MRLSPNKLTHFLEMSEAENWVQGCGFLVCVAGLVAILVADKIMVRFFVLTVLWCTSLVSIWNVPHFEK